MTTSRATTGRSEHASVTHAGELRESERVSGQGIGLSVVRELAQLNGGTIRIDESPLGGALIEIRFPAT